MLRLARGAPGERIDIGKRRLHVRDCGRGSPVVVSRPAPAAGATMGRGAAQLASTTRVLAYDRAGPGLER